MATLVLTAVGSALGGPIGAAVGAIVGQQIDRVVFKPATRQGPRLGDLAVQTSTYGNRLPKLFGTTRVAGTVIWATDLVETRTRQSNGKGRGATDVFSYTASFAVALSARPIVGLGRIWADGKLLRGLGGDLKVQTQLRVHDGAEDQAVDPLIAAHESGGATPAYRGIAYVVFEALQLADYGNRIPSLSFEVIADAGAVGFGTMIAELGGALVEAAAGPPLDGVAATGDTLRGVIEGFAATVPVLAGGVGDAVRLDFAPRGVTPPSARDHGAYRGTSRVPRATQAIDPLEATPVAVTLAYVDAARDYQPGLQRARREGAGACELRIDLPAVVPAATARRLAEAMVARSGVERRRLSIALPWRALDLRPGDGFAYAGRDWRIAQIALEDMVVRLDLIAASAAPGGAGAGPVAAGRSRAEVDAPHGVTTLALVDLPPLGEPPASTPQVAVFANGGSQGWRRAALLASSDGGVGFVPAGVTALPAIMGIAATVLGAGSTALIDRRSILDVDLLRGDLMLFDADTDALLSGANRAMIGREAVQFARAQPLGGRRWRLSGLWRGRAGTEGEVAGHRPGEVFVLLEERAMAMLPPSLAVPGVIVMVSGIGDDDPWPTARATDVGAAVRPLSPVAVQAARVANGDTIVTWTRRSRAGFGWRDAVDVPLGEEREAYRVTHAGAASIAADLTEPSYLYSAGARAADGAAGFAAVTIAIAQIGTGGASVPALIAVPTT